MLDTGDNLEGKLACYQSTSNLHCYQSWAKMHIERRLCSGYCSLRTALRHFVGRIYMEVVGISRSHSVSIYTKMVERFVQIQNLITALRYIKIPGQRNNPANS